MLAPALSHADPIQQRRGFGVTHERVLAVLLAAEVLLFCLIGHEFATGKNALNIIGLGVEIGLLALALTPVIVAGGIDLSVGSLLGLSAILFGKMWRDGGLPIGVAAALSLGVGALGGGLNALLITRLRIPALIVTLGSMSLFRGLAEAIARGVDNFTVPEHFQRILGEATAQVPVLAAAAAVAWLFLHRTAAGRSLYAIGFSPEGARHAGIPVERRVAWVYVVSGVASSLAAVMYVAHWSQAKADAGMGYELAAITAVVLGGTSIFGGRGTVHGTLLGLFAIVVLQNGLILADLPKELAGLLTGGLLLASIAVNQILSKLAKKGA